MHTGRVCLSIFCTHIHFFIPRLHFSYYYITLHRLAATSVPRSWFPASSGPLFSICTVTPPRVHRPPRLCHYLRLRLIHPPATDGGRSLARPLRSGFPTTSSPPARLLELPLHQCPSLDIPLAIDPNSLSLLMVLETPLLRVSRPVAACSRCRSAKVKCDGKLPACTACEKSGRANECSSTNDQFARGKERSYVATLEARIERLEKKLAETKQRRQSSVTMSDSDAQATPRPFGYPEVQTRKPKVSEQKAARRKEEADINDLVSDFGLLFVLACPSAHFLVLV